MLNRNMSKLDIEKCLASKGNFIKIDYITRFLREDIPLDMKKFCYNKLAETYESMKMFGDAAQTYNSLAIIALTFNDKINNYVKEAKSYILASEFSKADEATKKAMSEGNSLQKEEIYNEIKKFHRQVAEDCERGDKRNKASQIYEKFLEMKINDKERQDVKEKLIYLYEKLGKRVNFE